MCCTNDIFKNHAALKTQNNVCTFKSDFDFCLVYFEIKRNVLSQDVYKKI